ncbi:hypothetical protein TNCV_5111391 [Trichonephila clavipes]|nr:hypothetical protein TNCV_5111391 [Trichonephila clavipes]
MEWKNIYRVPEHAGSFGGIDAVHRSLKGSEPGEYKKSVESPDIADPTESFPIMCAYCDLVEPQIFGHTQAPLLKIIKVEGKDGEKKSSQCSLYKTSLRACYSTTVPND